jgi:4-diphosphocytidyl-2-C-methyl-D-erythritol kinase
MGAGLGGGSADGTYTLLLLNELFELKLDNDTLRDYAAKLGSDCPLFVEEAPQIATGRGEILRPFPINLSGYYIHLINLGIHVNTKDAFSNLILNQQKESIIETLKMPISDWKINLKNDFETTVFQKYPELKDLKDKLYEQSAEYVSMTGSGSTIYAIKKQKPTLIFENEKILEKIVYIK